MVTTPYAEKPIYSCLQCGKQVAIGELETIIKARKKEERRRKMETVTNTIPLKPRKNAHLLHAYYEQNKERIIADFRATLNAKETMQKWGLSEAGWNKIAKRWGLVPTIKPETIAKTEKPLPPQDVKGTPEKPINIDGITLVVLKGELPKFPEWNDIWLSDLKLKWLEVYGQIMSSQKVAV